MAKPSEISQHLCVSASMNGSAGTLDPFIGNCCEIAHCLTENGKRVRFYKKKKEKPCVQMLIGFLFFQIAWELIFLGKCTTGEHSE